MNLFTCVAAGLSRHRYLGSLHAEEVVSKEEMRQETLV